MSDIQLTLPLHPDAESQLDNRPLITLTANRLRPLAEQKVRLGRIYCARIYIEKVFDRCSFAIQDTSSKMTVEEDEFEYDVYKSYGLLSVAAKSGNISMTAQQIRQLGKYSKKKTQSSPTAIRRLYG